MPTSCSRSTPRTRIGLRHPRSDIEHAACAWPIVALRTPRFRYTCRCCALCISTCSKRSRARRRLSSRAHAWLASQSISFIHCLIRSVKQHGVASPNNRNIRLRLNQTCDARHEWFHRIGSCAADRKRPMPALRRRSHERSGRDPRVHPGWGPGLQFASLLARRSSRGRWLSLARMQSSGPTRSRVSGRSNACD
jgi:hypothetical protein